MFSQILTGMGVALGLGLGLCCTAMPEIAQNPTPATSTAAALPRGHVILHTQPAHTVEVEVAQSAAAHRRGLMFRRSLAADAGMLFVFEHGNIDAPRTFWMRNTYLPLDMLFIAKNGQVVHLIERAEPLSLDARASTQPCAFVLEVNGGYAAAHHVQVGTSVSFADLSF